MPKGKGFTADFGKRYKEVRFSIEEIETNFDGSIPS